jgi:hypothetical protein
MRLKTAARLALLGLIYVFSVKMIDTLFHGVFRPFALAGSVVGVNILAGLAQVLFFLVFRRSFVPAEKPALAAAALLAVLYRFSNQRQQMPLIADGWQKRGFASLTSSIELGAPRGRASQVAFQEQLGIRLPDRPGAQAAGSGRPGPNARATGFP